METTIVERPSGTMISEPFTTSLRIGKKYITVQKIAMPVITPILVNAMVDTPSERKPEAESATVLTHIMMRFRRCMRWDLLTSFFMRGISFHAKINAQYSQTQARIARCDVTVLYNIILTRIVGESKTILNGLRHNANFL